MSTSHLDPSIRTARPGTGTLDPAKAPIIRAKLEPATLTPLEAPQISLPVASSLSTRRLDKGKSSPVAQGLDFAPSETPKAAQSNAPAAVAFPSGETQPVFVPQPVRQLEFLPAVKPERLGGLSSESVVSRLSMQGLRQGVMDERKQEKIMSEIGKNQETLESFLKQLSPELAALLDGDSSPGQAKLDNNLNYSLSQMLVSVNADLHKAVNAVVSRLRTEPGSSPTPAEAKLLASFDLEWKQPQLMQVSSGMPWNPERPLNLADLRLGGLQNALAMTKAGLKPSPQIQELLASFGLFAQAGKVYNLVDNSQLSGPQLEILDKTLEHLRSGQDAQWERKSRLSLGVESAVLISPDYDFSDKTKVISGFHAKLASLTSSLVESLANSGEIQSRIEQNRLKMDQQEVELSRQNDDNAATAAEIVVQEAKFAKLRHEGQSFERAHAWLLKLPAGQSLDEAWQKLSEAERQDYESGLASQNLRLEREQGKLVLKYSGGSLDQPSLESQFMGRSFGAKESDLVLAGIQRTRSRKLREFETGIGNLRQRYQQGLARAGVLREDLKLLKQTQGQEISSLHRSDEILRASRSELIALRNSPDWNQLSPEVRQEVDRLIKASDASLSRSESVVQHANESIERAERAIRRSLEEDKRAVRLLKQLSEMLQQLKVDLEVLDQLLAKLPTPIQTDINQLLERVDALERELTLVPRPLFTGAEALREAWAEMLSEAERSFAAHAKQVQASASGKHSQDNAQLRKVKESLDYHLDRLAQSSELSRDQLVKFLQSSLQNLHSQLLH